MPANGWMLCVGYHLLCAQRWATTADTASPSSAKLLFMEKKNIYDFFFFFLLFLHSFVCRSEDDYRPGTNEMNGMNGEAQRLRASARPLNGKSEDKKRSAQKRE